MIITIEDVRACGLCVSGARTFFQRYHLNFSAFLKRGIDADVLRNCNDALANQVIDYKMQKIRKTAHG